MDYWVKHVRKFGKVHKLFLQLLLKEKLLLHQEVGLCFLKIVNSFTDRDEAVPTELAEDQNKNLVKMLLEKLNEELREVGMQALRVPDESRPSTEYITIISDRSYSEVLAQSGGFSTDELAKFQVWLKMMFGKSDDSDDVLNSSSLSSDGNTSANGENSVGELRIHRALNSKVGGLSASGAQKLINKLIDAQWLALDRVRDVFRLHPRAAAELSNGVQAEFNLPVCELCRAGIFLRRMSYNCACGFSYHARCLRKILEGKVSTKCNGGNCNRQLTVDLVEAFDFDDDIQQQRQRRRSGSSAGLRVSATRRTYATEDAEVLNTSRSGVATQQSLHIDEDAPMDEDHSISDEEIAETQQLRRTQRSTTAASSSASQRQPQMRRAVKREPIASQSSEQQTQREILHVRRRVNATGSQANSLSLSQRVKKEPTNQPQPRKSTRRLTASTARRRVVTESDGEEEDERAEEMEM